MTPWEVAREFDRLIVEEARFDPPQKPDHEKAVEVRKFLLDGKGVVQIATTWVK